MYTHVSKNIMRQLCLPPFENLTDESSRMMDRSVRRSELRSENLSALTAQSVKVTVPDFGDQICLRSRRSVGLQNLS